jgi:hypothetical protein
LGVENYESGQKWSSLGSLSFPERLARPINPLAIFLIGFSLAAAFASLHSDHLRFVERGEPLHTTWPWTKVQQAQNDDLTKRGWQVQEAQEATLAEQPAPRSLLSSRR